MNISLQSIGFLPNLRLLEQIDHGFQRITLRVHPMTTAASCPACGTPSRRVHGSYWRTLSDVACFGRPTVLLVRVRRFRCARLACQRQTFTEPLPGIACARARQTERLRAVHRSIGLALGGNPGSRHAAAMGMPISGTTLLRRVRTGTNTPVSPVRVLGVDDWAWRKGHRYGTILCDLERRRVIDLLPDRSANTLAAWLAAHPGVSVVVRDRAGAYADGTARGAPHAKQTADRWHLLRNGSEALRAVLEHHHRDLRQAARTAAPPAREDSMVLEPAAVPEPEPRLRTSERRSQAAQARRDARFAEAARLREQGLSIRVVALTLGVERKTVRRWLQASHAPTWRHADRGSSILDPHRAWLEERWQAGCRNTAALWRELEGRGFSGQYSTVRAWGTRRRRQDPAVEPAGASRTSRLVKVLEPPTPRRAARLLASELAKPSKEDRRFVTALRKRSAIIATAADLIGRFTSMVKDKTPAALDSWLN